MSSVFNSRPSAPSAGKTKRPKMLGAHVPRKPVNRARRCQLCESAALINRAYDERFARQNAHLVWLRHGFNS